MCSSAATGGAAGSATEGIPERGEGSARTPTSLSDGTGAPSGRKEVGRGGLWVGGYMCVGGDVSVGCVGGVGQ